MKRVLAAGMMLWMAASAAPLRGQPPLAVPPDAAAPTARLEVFLITIGEGEEYWEKFGHNALWFFDPSSGIDITYNWGTFDFAAPDFLQRQLVGDPRYWVEGVPRALLVQVYEQYDRTIVVQRLALAPDQARGAYEFVLRNARDEYKYYQYDYFRDNCSTRVRDVIDLATGGALKAATGTRLVDRTYRSESVRLVDDMPLIQFGIDAALGHPADLPLTVWQDMFVPARMRDAIRGVRVADSAGTSSRPLVAEERVVYRSQGHAERPEAPSLWIGYLAVGLLIAAELAATGWMGERSTALDVVFRVEAAVWSLITGMLGAALLGAWLATRHVFWFRNENLMLLNPLSLWLLVLVLMSLRNPRWTRAAAAVSVAIAAAGGIALLVKAIPAFGQDNLPMILLLLPPHIALAAGLWRRTRLPAASSRAA